MSEQVDKAHLVLMLRRQGIRDNRVLSAMERVPREKFVHPDFLEHAYEDRALPIECGQTISQPFIVAYMLQEARLDERHKVLEIGTGSGYQTALLSYLTRRVYSIERHRPLLKSAEARLQELDIVNVTTRHADGYEGWPEQGSFDRIIVTAAPTEVPQALIDQLGPDGILILPLTESDDLQTLVRLTRQDGRIVNETLIPVRFVPMLEDIE